MRYDPGEETKDMMVERETGSTGLNYRYWVLQMPDCSTGFLKVSPKLRCDHRQEVPDHDCENKKNSQANADEGGA